MAWRWDGVLVVVGGRESRRRPGRSLPHKGPPTWRHHPNLRLEGDLSSWVVSAPPQTAPKSALPASLWVTTGQPKLALVTCGGPFDAATGHYSDNLIVWATEA